MRFPRPLVSGQLIRRYKRFFAEVRLDSGDVVLAHCPNPGAMHTVAEVDGPVWLLPADPVLVAAGKRKLAWTWVVALCGQDRVPVLVDTSMPNGVVIEAISAGQIPALAGYPRLRPEVRYGEKSRVDALLESDAGRCYVEVKNVSLLVSPGLAAFPDAVTARGARHLAELSAVRGPDTRAVLLYLVREDADTVLPAEQIDPAYARALRAAVASGVEVLAYQARVTRDDVVLGPQIKVAGL